MLSQTLKESASYHLKRIILILLEHGQVGTKYIHVPLTLQLRDFCTLNFYDQALPTTQMVKFPAHRNGVGIGGRGVGFEVKGGVGARDGCVDKDGVRIGGRGVGFEVKGGVGARGECVDKDGVGIGGHGVGFEVKGGVGAREQTMEKKRLAKMELTFVNGRKLTCINGRKLRKLNRASNGEEEAFDPHGTEN
ncbi:uncharacterized protein G2W53_044404 [Senna tora]|uniref:Uncharacterized protein n=1 Tax=Senna tora TaxID=362788 RepID=A0A834W125_9FABA|nr:uncharacterized protein G2W53_044404 [Senna tora]